MADVAAAAGVSKPLLYHYFPTKTSLYRAAVRAAADALRESTATPPGQVPSTGRRAALRAHLDWVSDNAEAYRAVLQGAVCADEEVQAVVEGSRADLVDRLATGMRLGTLEPGQRVMLRGWVGLLEGACLDWLAARDVPTEEMVDLLEASLDAVGRLTRPVGARR